jgi:hypothetical protein
MLPLSSCSLCPVARLLVLLLLCLCSAFLSMVTVEAQPVLNNITSTTGCQSVSAFVMNDCNPGSSVVVFSGSDLLWPVSVTVGGLPCPMIYYAASGSQVRCQLPAPQGYSTTTSC